MSPRKSQSMEKCMGAKKARRVIGRLIGVQFSEADFAAATKIEEHLGTGLVSDRPTHTMRERCVTEV